jgi:hypothetical protein
VSMIHKASGESYAPGHGVVSAFFPEPSHP